MQLLWPTAGISFNKTHTRRTLTPTESAEEERKEKKNTRSEATLFHINAPNILRIHLILGPASKWNIYKNKNKNSSSSSGGGSSNNKNYDHFHLYVHNVFWASSMLLRDYTTACRLIEEHGKWKKTAKNDINKFFPNNRMYHVILFMCRVDCCVCADRSHDVGISYIGATHRNPFVAVEFGPLNFRSTNDARPLDHPMPTDTVDKHAGHNRRADCHTHIS